MSALAKLSVLFASLLIASLALGKEPLTHAQKIAALIDPAKLSTLAPRGANPAFRSMWLNCLKLSKRDWTL
jgi:hypothetical protein